MCDVVAIAPNPQERLLLPGAQFSDAYSIALNQPMDARRAAERMMAGKTWWIDALLVLRNIIVAPFYLKGGPSKCDGADVIGFFPVITQTPNRLVAGFDDRHLDFRVVVETTAADTRRLVIATTVVLTHNVFGRIYLATIMPFHRLIVRTMLRRVRDQ